jgi:hypothetical protein
MSLLFIGGILLSEEEADRRVFGLGIASGEKQSPCFVDGFVVSLLAMTKPGPPLSRDCGVAPNLLDFLIFLALHCINYFQVV